MMATDPALFLDEAVHHTPANAAVISDDTVIDYERLDECVEWLCADFAACGIQAHMRVDLSLAAGTNLVIATHALVRMGTVVVLPCAANTLPTAESGDPGIHFVIADYDDSGLEDTITDLTGRDACPVFYAGHDFAVALVNDAPPRDDRTGFIIDPGRRVIDWAEYSERIENPRHTLALNTDPEVRIGDDWTATERILGVLACARRGACVEITATESDLSPRPLPLMSVR